ncbi:hypothetical protein HC024_21010 [Methylococcaceae bacterium WWC4]|uniref:hypothetical protein n=1 Tax=Methylomonas sp. LWB TaxID=1905845 RepID=UPI0011151E8C|nr:hypothetical protein [Methylomonas sp. LWB]NJA08192.1 hypothetical protein [Methylococcaceae bacterium WWC4]
MTNLIDIAPAFAFILDKGFVPGESEYKPQEFGNAVLVMTGTQFSLRFERDRGQVFIDVGNNIFGWYKLEYVLEFLDCINTQSQLGAPPEPRLLASLLQQLWEKVIALFSTPEEISQLQIFSKQKSTALLDKIFRRP